MASTKYTYLISAFPHQKVASNRLTLEIRDSVIVTALDYISTDDTGCDIWFKDGLTSEDKTLLDGIVAAHSGEPLPQPGFESDGTPIVSMKQKQPDGIPA